MELHPGSKPKHFGIHTLVGVYCILVLRRNIKFEIAAFFYLWWGYTRCTLTEREKELRRDSCIFKNNFTVHRAPQNGGYFGKIIGTITISALTLQ